eukprot:COSAG06_NODE_3259_length_5604_cov_7.478520_3_plen_1681_part_01
MSVGEPCSSEERTTTFNSSVSCHLPAAPLEGECTSAQRSLWSQLSGSYTFDVCREIANRDYYREPSPLSGDVDECTAETQVRSRENNGAWSPWSGTNLFADCVAEPMLYENRTRWQEAEVKFPAPCVGELQVRLRAASSLDEEASFGAWSGTNSFASCMQRDVAVVPCVDRRSGATMVNPFGDCAVRRVQERAYSMDTQTAEVSEGSWSEPVLVASNCADLCQDMIRPAKYTQYQSGTVVNGECLAANGCFEDWDGTVVNSACTPVVTDMCVRNAEGYRYIDDDNDVSSVFATCTEVERQTRYFSPYARNIEDCLSEVQTRSRMMSGTAPADEPLSSQGIADGVWTPWSGTYIYDDCDSREVEFEQRTLWQQAEILYNWQNPGPPCTQETQTRTRFNVTDAQWSAWSGTYEYSACVESWANNLAAGEFTQDQRELACPATEVKSRTNNGQWTDTAISMDYCDAVQCAVPTVVCPQTVNDGFCDAIRFKNGLVVGAECEYELGWQCDTADNAQYYIGNYSLSTCVQTETRIRWQSLWSEGSACISETQTRSRVVTSDGAAPVTNAWSIWSGSYSYSSCTETRFVQQQDDTHFPISQLSQCDPSTEDGVMPLGADVCAKSLRLERRVNDGEWIAGPRYSDVCPNPADSLQPGAATDFVPDPQNCTESMWFLKPVANVNDNDNCSGIVRRSCTSPTFGEIPLSGNPLYKYGTCTEIDQQERYYKYDDSDEGCIDFSELQERSREPGGSWSEWSGDFEYNDCGLGMFADTRVRWQNAQSACLDTGDVLPCGESMCKESTDCVMEVQSRVRVDIEIDQVWGEWSGSYTFNECVQTETITRWAAYEVTDQNCESETRSRLRQNNGRWAEWDGSFDELECTEIRTRTRWAAGAAGAGECIPEEQTRRRTNNGEWGDWSGTYEFAQCIETESKLAWLSQFISGEACESEVQTRTRHLINSQVPWSDWVSPTGSSDFIYDTCTEIEFRTRYENEFTVDLCISEDQSRQRVNNAPWPVLQQNGAGGGWSGIFQYDNCIQLEGVQMETRIMYREDAVQSPATCEFEMQTRTRAGGGAWNSWTGLDQSRPAWQFKLCREYDSVVTWKHPLCDGSAGGCAVCESQIERRSRSVGEPWPDWSIAGYAHCTEQQSKMLYETTEVVGSECTGEMVTRSRADGAPWAADGSDWVAPPMLLALGLQVCTERETVTRYACPVASDSECASEVRTRSRAAGDTTWGDWDGSYEYVECFQVQTRERVDYATKCLSETQTRSRSCTEGCATWSQWGGTYKYDDPGCRHGPGESGSAVLTEAPIAGRANYHVAQTAGMPNGRPGFPVPESKWKPLYTMVDGVVVDENEGRHALPCTRSEPLVPCTPACAACGFGSTDDWERQERIKWQDAVTYVDDSGSRPGCVFEYQHRIGRPGNTRSTSWRPWSGTYGFDACTEIKIEIGVLLPDLSSWTETSGCTLTRRTKRELKGHESIIVLDGWPQKVDAGWDTTPHYDVDINDDCVDQTQADPLSRIGFLPGMTCNSKRGWSNTYAVNDATYLGFNPAVGASYCEWMSVNIWSCAVSDAVSENPTIIRLPYWSEDCVDIDSQVKYKDRDVVFSFDQCFDETGCSACTAEVQERRKIGQINDDTDSKLTMDWLTEPGEQCSPESCSDGMRDDPAGRVMTGWPSNWFIPCDDIQDLCQLE